MWLVVRLALAALVGWGRSYGGPAAFNGDDLTVDGVAMRLSRTRSRGSVTGSTLVVDTGWKATVAFRRERGWDRLFKAFGVVREHQHGDSGFDARVFVECDDPRLARILLEPPVGQVIVRVLRRGADLIFCEEGQLGLRWSGEAGTDDYAADLAAIATAWRARPEVAAARAEPFAWRALLVSCLMWSLAAWVVVAVLELWWTSFPQLASWSGAWGIGLAASPPLYLALLLLAGLTLRRSSHAARAFTEVVLLGIIVAPLLAVVSIFDVDTRCDSSPAERFVGTVILNEHHVTRGSKGTTIEHYSVTVDGWEGGPTLDGAALPRTIEIPASTSASVRMNHPVELLAHRGALGLPWIEDLRSPER